MKYLPGLLIIWLCACTQSQKANRELSIYFDLDSLLDSQVEMLSNRQYKVIKTVKMDDEEETQTLVLDSAGWAGEFAIARAFDLNKPNNVGAYSVSRNDSRIVYVLADSTLEAPVKSLTIENTGNKLIITGKYFEDKSIYQHNRELRLVLEDQLMSTYEVTGFQKMVMKDSIHYRVRGEVRINE